MNNIIFVEDQENFANDFITNAFSKGIYVKHCKSLNGLKSLLPKLEHKYIAVILDIKCLIDDDQEIENANFIGAAITYLDQNVPRFPRFILTGDDTEFESLSRYYTSEKLFLKTPQELENLFRDIADCIKNSEYLRIKREFWTVFEIFENGLIDNQGEKQLLNIIKTGVSEKNALQFKGILADVRSMQELIYKTINSRNTDVVPNAMFKSNGMLKFNELMKHLSGNLNPQYQPTSTVYQNNTIANLAKTLYWSCGEYIHEEPDRAYFISDNTIKALLYSLLEILL